MARDVIQLFGHIFAKLTQLAAAIAAGLAGRQDSLLALEVLGQRRTVVGPLALCLFLFRCSPFVDGIVLGLLLGRGFDLGVLLQVQRQLFGGLGFGAKAGLAMSVQLGLQLLVLVGQRLDALDHQLADGPQLSRVIGQGFEGLRHAREYTGTPDHLEPKTA